MGKRIHIITGRDEDGGGVCAECGPVKLRKKSKGRMLCPNSQRRWDAAGRTAGTYAYQVHKGDACERCKFVAEHGSQLDVHHSDGNRLNNEVANLTTLCANCHRLYTNAPSLV